MKRKAYQAVFTATLVVVMVAFLSTIFFANTNPSFAASGKKKSPAIARTSAVVHTEAQIKQLQDKKVQERDNMTQNQLKEENKNMRQMAQILGWAGSGRHNKA